MRKIYYWDKREQRMVSAEEFFAKQEPRQQTHYVIQDTMDPMRHPGNREFYDSKSAFRAETKRRGLTEVGNDWEGKPAPAVEPSFKSNADTLKRLLEKLQ